MAEETRTIVVVGAHPDDETLGPGGAVARRIREGWEVVVIVLTGGANLLKAGLGITADPSPEEVARTRRDETRRATAILGVKPENVIFLDYGDGSLAQREEEATEQLAALLKEHAPVEVWSLSEYEGHPDHVAASRIARAACAGTGIRLRRYVVSLRYGLKREDIPERFEPEDISEVLPLKRRAVNEFQSHLGMLSKQQEKPLWEDPDRYLRPEEPFIVED